MTKLREIGEKNMRMDDMCVYYIITCVIYYGISKIREYFRFRK